MCLVSTASAPPSSTSSQSMHCGVRAHASFADVPPSDLKITGQLHVLVSFCDFPFDPDLAVVERPFNRSGAMAALSRSCRCPR